MRPGIAVMCAAAVSIATAACQPTTTGTEGSEPVTFVATDYKFDGPPSVPAGMTLMEIDNQGAEPHQIQLLKLDEDMTMSDFQAAMMESPEALPEWARPWGGPNAVEPGASGSAYVDLVQGQYVLVCNVPSPDGVAHVAKGMISPLEVTAAEGAGATEPSADVTITAVDYQYEISQPITSGEHTIRFDNNGTEPHELTVIRLDEGKTAADFAAAVEPGGSSGPLPGQIEGGIAAIEPGAHSTYTATFEPGHYALICFVPDDETGQPHVTLGMSTEFDVQ